MLALFRQDDAHIFVGSSLVGLFSIAQSRTRSNCNVDRSSLSNIFLFETRICLLLLSNVQYSVQSNLYNYWPGICLLSACIKEEQRIRNSERPTVRSRIEGLFGRRKIFSTSTPTTRAATCCLQHDLLNFDLVTELDPLRIVHWLMVLYPFSISLSDHLDSSSNR